MSNFQFSKKLSRKKILKIEIWVFYKLLPVMLTKNKSFKNQKKKSKKIYDFFGKKDLDVFLLSYK